MLFRLKKLTMIKKIILLASIFAVSTYFLIYISFNSITFNYDPIISNGYSVWPKFLVISNLKKEYQFVSDYWTAETNQLMSLESMKEFIEKISLSTNEKLQNYYQMLNDMYDFKFESTRLSFNSDLQDKLKAWLNNNDKLLEESKNQVSETRVFILFKNIRSILFIFR